MLLALPEANAGCGPVMWPLIVYVAPLLRQGRSEVSVLVTWNATGSSTIGTAAPATPARAPSSTSQASPVRTKLATHLRRRVAPRSICPTTSRSSLRIAPPSPLDNAASAPHRVAVARAHRQLSKSPNWATQLRRWAGGISRPAPRRNGDRGRFAHARGARRPRSRAGSARAAAGRTGPGPQRCGVLLGRARDRQDGSAR